MTAELPHVVVLGAGPAGLGAAYRLRTRNRARVTVLERTDRYGGNAGGFWLHDVPVDFGSHRLHPSCAPAILADIRELLADDLRTRPRHGRIRLQGRWIHFPLKPLDLLLSMPPRFGAGVAADLLRKLWPRATGNGATASFASVLEQGLGRTICRDFYFPYAVKMWGEEPQSLSPIQARRRVSAGSLAKT
jgi:protoporphyrinogen oxidase